MTSKTFKSVWNDRTRLIHVRSVDEGVNIQVSDAVWAEQYGGTIAPSDAPALALAILEAAGHEGDAKKVGIGTIEGQFANAVFHLRRGLVRQERATAEAEAQAELEAEALRLANEFYGTDWDFFPCSRTVEMQQWLAVARRAREINKEEK